MKHTVLIVDDSPENIGILKGILCDQYNIKVALDGKTAIKVAEKTNPDIILLDVIMPDLDGYSVCEKLKKNPITRNIPVIFVTAKDHDLDEIRGFEVGAVDYVTKPVSPVIVKARLKTQLALSDQNWELKRQVKEKTKEIAETRLEIIKRLGRAGEHKDKNTGLHVERVSKYVYHIAKSYGFDEFQAEMLLNVAPMHDIGKIGIPESILGKKGSLSDEEFLAMKDHCIIGAEIMGVHGSEIIEFAKIVAMQHHEKWNGTGYPIGLLGEEINIGARIVAIADVFDALITKRAYKEPWSVDAAVKYLKDESGNHFDPKVVDAFIESLDDILHTVRMYSEKSCL